MGEILLEIADRSIKQKVKHDNDWLPDGEFDAEILQEKRGVFTTIYNKLPNDKKLRGCVGLPHASEELGKAVALSARRAASEDPRFSPLTPEELDQTIYSVEVLSKFESLEFETKQDLFDKITIGKDGLLIRYKEAGGLLLPKVAEEQGWGVNEYLINLCHKAFLPPSILNSEDVELSKFTTQFFTRK